MERLTFDRLFRISEPKRVYRSFTVRGPPLEIDSYQDVVYYIFNFKANPSTTGLRHRGYVKFFKPKHKNPKDVPLQHLECLVDCTCFAAGAQVLMSDGACKPIQDVKVGDMVYTHRGRARRVTRAQPRAVKTGENVYALKVAGWPEEMVVTGTHPFYALRGNGRFDWVKVDDFRSQEWFLAPWLESSGQNADPDFARLVEYTTSNDTLASQVSTILSRLQVRHTVSYHNKGEDRCRMFQVLIPRGESGDVVRSWLQPFLRDKDLKHSSRTEGLHRLHYSRPEGQLRGLLRREKIEFHGTVYDLTVEEDESFIVNGVAVHNCPDFRYRWAWANKQRQSSVVGPNSLNQAWNKAPRKTNPSGRPGLCKHILAARSYIYGLLSSFPGDSQDSAYKLDRLTKYATKRWTDFEGQMQAAKAKEVEIRRRREMRNQGQRPVVPPALPEPKRETEPSINAPASAPADKKAQATTDLKKVRPEPLPLAIPPGQRGRNLPTATKPEQGKEGETIPAATPTTKPKRIIGNRKINPIKPGDQGWIRPEEAHLCEPLRDLILERVVKANGEFMSNIKEAIKLVEEMEADELEHDALPPADLDDVGGDTLEPSEPPISDSAIGADTEGDSALSLLRSMKNSLEQIAAAVAPVETEPTANVPAGPVATEEVEEFSMPEEPPADLEAEGEAEEAEGKAKEDEAEAEADEDYES